MPANAIYSFQSAQRPLIMASFSFIIIIVVVIIIIIVVVVINIIIAVINICIMLIRTNFIKTPSSLSRKWQDT